MAARKTSAPASGRTYEPDQIYDVQLLRVAEWNGVVLSPGKENLLKGKVCQAIDADIADWQTAYYAENLTRLMQVKKQYDPENVFHGPQSIPLPAVPP